MGEVFTARDTRLDGKKTDAKKALRAIADRLGL